MCKKSMYTEKTANNHPSAEEQKSVPSNFVKKPSTERLKKKTEEWVNNFLIHGAGGNYSNKP